VVELAPDDAEARALRGRTYLALRQFRKAADDLRVATQRFPGRPDIVYQLAVALDGDHKPAEALRAAEAALRLAPDFADARALSHRLALAAGPAVRPRPLAADAQKVPPVEPAK
jgi:tetratricopeptide (TPR) repeat protein